MFEADHTYEVHGLFRAARAIYVRQVPGLGSGHLTREERVEAYRDTVWYSIDLASRPVIAKRLLQARDSRKLDHCVLKLTGAQIGQLCCSIRVKGDTDSLVEFGLRFVPTDPDELAQWQDAKLEQAEQRRKERAARRAPTNWEQPSERYARRFLNLLGLQRVHVAMLNAIVDKLLEIVPSDAVKRLSSDATDVLFSRAWLESIRGTLRPADFVLPAGT